MGDVQPAAVGASERLAFERFVAGDGERLRRALIAHFGLDVGEDVTADAFAWAWEHWREVAPMENPVGYLYRVGQSAARRHRRWRRPVVLPPEEIADHMPVEPGLDVALARLPPAHRVAVLLVHALGWSYQEVADATGVPITTVRNHLHRGLRRLRRELGDGT